MFKKTLAWVLSAVMLLCMMSGITLITIAEAEDPTTHTHQHTALSFIGLGSGDQTYTGEAVDAWEAKFSDGLITVDFNSSLTFGDMTWRGGGMWGPNLGFSDIWVCRAEDRAALIEQIRANEMHVYDNTCDTTCNICGAEREITHTYAGDCDSVCDVCGHEREVTVDHTYDNNRDTICNVCGHERELPFTEGDVNNDDRIDSTDARLTLQYFVGTVSESEIMLAAADVDGNGKVDSTDARLILQLFVGSITEFPKA